MLICQKTKELALYSAVLKMMEKKMSTPLKRLARDLAPVLPMKTDKIKNPV
jgi:hypothetical protein